MTKKSHPYGVYRATVNLPGMRRDSEEWIDPNEVWYLPGWIDAGYLVYVRGDNDAGKG